MPITIWEWSHEKISIHNSFKSIRHLAHANQSSRRLPQLKQSVKTLKKQRTIWVKRKTSHAHGMAELILWIACISEGDLQSQDNSHQNSNDIPHELRKK